MKKILFILAYTSFLFTFSCKPIKKAEHVQKQIEKRDTSKIVFVSPTTASSELDTLHSALADLDSQRIKGFGTFSGKAKVDYTNDGSNASVHITGVTANIHIKEDSIIWISVTAILGIEAARIEITPDSLIMMDKQHKKVTRKSIAYLQEILKAPIGFSDLQNILLGNPFYVKGNISSYKHPRNQWFVTIDGDKFTNFITITDNNKKLFLKHSRLQDSTSTDNRICDMTFNAHQQTLNNKWFSQNRVIQVSDYKTNLQIKLQFKEFHFGEEVSFPFNIPSNYDEQ